MCSIFKTRNLVTRYMLKGEPILIDNKQVYLRKSEGVSSSESMISTLESSVIPTYKWLSMGVILTQMLFNT